MYRIAACCVLAVGFTPVLMLAEEQGGGKGNKYAFLVGCSKYLKTQFHELPFTGNDVKGFRDALLKTGFPDEQVVVLHDATTDPARYLPQRANILRELELLLDGMRKEDTLVVALSGHGLQFQGDPVSYFVPVDGKVEEKATLIALSGKDGLYELLKKCKAQQKLLIVNACRNDPTVGLDFSSKKVTLADEDRNEVPEGIAAIYSCMAGQKSYYDPDRKMALFFDHVIRAWKGEYDSTGEVTLEKFFEQVTIKTKMDAYKLQVPQTPSVQREYTGKWVIATADLTKARENERLLAADFAEFSGLRLGGDKNKIDSWLQQRAATRLVAWREAANRGSPEAIVVLGQCRSRGKGLAKDEVEAVKWFRKAAELGNAWGQFDLGCMYEGGRGVPRNHTEAIKWYRKAAEQGDAYGQNNLGCMYGNGRGVAKDFGEALKWYRKAAEQGCARAQSNLGAVYDLGRGVPKDYAEAIKWFRKAAEQGDPEGQANLGAMYDNGRGVPKDYAEAVKWYRKAGDQGCAWAQRNLGNMYDNGQGVPKDYGEAVKWYRKAAEQGDAEGQTNLGWMYDNGRGLAKDSVEAFKWYRKAADQGDAYAQRYLGYMYETGRGVRVDLAEAVRWYRLASQGGNQEATDALRRLGKE